MRKIAIWGSAVLLAVSCTASAADFYDISGHWAEDTINNLADNGIVSGVDTNEFQPDGTVTRAQYLKMIMETLNISATAFRDGECLEARDDMWYAPYLQRALDSGLIPDEMITSCKKSVEYEVDEDGNAVSSRVIYSGAFNGELPITREEMAVLTMYCYQYTRNVRTNTGAPEDNTTSFDDEMDCSVWALNSVLKASEYGFMTGMEDGNFRPANNATRAEAATVVERVLNFLQL